MIKAIRKAAVYVMFGILVVAFAVSFGGGMDYFRTHTSQTVAKVGSVEITPQRFQQYYRRTIDNLSQRTRHAITAQEARAARLPERVLQELIQDAALDLEAKQLGLGLSNDGLRKLIQSNENFLDASGKFSPEKYQQFLDQVGFTPIGFEQEIRGDLIRSQLRAIFEKSAVVPETLLNAFNNYMNEQRTLDYFTLDAAAAGKIEPPTPEALKAYYDEHKSQFLSPELRKVGVVAVTPEIIRETVTINDSDLRAAYDSKAAAYAVPEKRKVEIIPFQTKDAAETAAKALATKKDFLEVAKEAGFTPAEIDLGLVSRDELSKKFVANDAVLNAAFSLQKGQTSTPVEGPLSFVIIRVSEIVPGKSKSFDEVKAQIRDDLVKARTTQEISRLSKAFEEDRTAGVPIADTAKKLGLTIQEATLDQNGNGEDGNAVDIPGVPPAQLAKTAFDYDEGLDIPVMRLPNNGYAWIEVQKVIKARELPLEEVKAKAEDLWRRDQIRTKLTEKGRELSGRLDKGEKIADVAKSVGAEVKTTKPLKRTGSEPGLPPAAIPQAFALAEGEASSAAIGDGVSRAVFQVSKVTPAQPLEGQALEAMRSQLAQLVASDNFAQFLASITKREGVSVDQKTFAAVAGGAIDFGE